MSTSIEKNKQIDSLTAGSINGAVKIPAVTGPVSVSGALSAPIIKPPVTNGVDALTVTEELHAGTIVFQTNLTGDIAYTIPAPSAAGVIYRFVGAGDAGQAGGAVGAADGHDLTLSVEEAGTVQLEGVIAHLDTDAGGTGGVAPIFIHNNHSHVQLQVNLPAGYDITLIAVSTTKYYVTGWVMAAPAPVAAA